MPNADVISPFTVFVCVLLGFNNVEPHPTVSTRTLPSTTALRSVGLENSINDSRSAAYGPKPFCIYVCMDHIHIWTRMRVGRHGSVLQNYQLESVRLRAEESWWLREPMIGSPNINPHTHPHLLAGIQQGLTHRQTHKPVQCDRLEKTDTQNLLSKLSRRPGN